MNQRANELSAEVGRVTPCAPFGPAQANGGTQWTARPARGGWSISSVNWSNVGTTPADDGTTKTVIVTPPAGNRFYRLSKP